MLVCSWFLIFVIFNTEGLQKFTTQSRNVKFEIQSLSKRIEELTNKADDLRKSNTKHNIFIDIETLRPFALSKIGRSKEYMHHRYLKKHKDPQFNKYFTVKSAMSSFKSLSTKVKIENQIYFKRSPMVFAKVLTSLPAQGISAKFDNRKQYQKKRSNINQTRDSFNIKKKVLTQLQRLENDIKVVKAQIENDTRTIEDLQNQLRQKEKQRTKLKLMNEKATIVLKTFIEKPAIKMLTKSLDNDTTTTTDKNEKFKLNLDENTQKLQQLTKTIKSQTKNEKKYKQINSTDLHKLYKYRRHSNITSRDYLKSISKNIDINKVEGDDLHQDFYIDEIKKNENTLSSTSKTKYDINYIKLNKNISNEENVENITVSTPSIFDLHEDFETFERFDGEFDWEKFITSEMYVQIIKNTTAEPDFRRMLSDEKKATVPDLSKAVTSFEEKFWDDYYLERTIPVHPQVVTGNSNSSKTRLVPRPSLQKTYLETITLPEIKKSLNGDNNIRNLGMRYLNNPRRIPGGQYPVIDGRKNMPTLPTIQTTADQILYDSIIRDIDKDIDI